MMRKNIAIQSMTGCAVVMLLAVSLASCSRQEKPKAPEKKAQSFNVSPVPAAEVAKLVGKTNEVKAGLLDATDVVRSLNSRKAKDPAARKAFIARRTEYAKKSIAREIEKIEKETDELVNQIVMVEGNARLSNATVEASARVLGNARQDYERERYALPGMAEIKRERDAVMARLAERQGKDVQPDALANMKREILELTKKMYDTEMAGRADETTALSKAVDGVKTAESAYYASLMTEPDYKNLDAKRQALSERNKDLLERQSALGHEEK